MRHSVDTKILQKIINYIAGKPYTEVAALITELQQDAKVIEGTEEQPAIQEGTVNEN